MRLIFYNEARELQDYQRFANSRWTWLTKPGQQNNASIHFFYPQWTKKNSYLKRAARFLFDARFEC